MDRLMTMMELVVASSIRSSVTGIDQSELNIWQHLATVARLLSTTRNAMTAIGRG